MSSVAGAIHCFSIFLGTAEKLVRNSTFLAEGWCLSFFGGRGCVRPFWMRLFAFCNIATSRRGERWSKSKQHESQSQLKFIIAVPPSRGYNVAIITTLARYCRRQPSVTHTAHGEGTVCHGFSCARITDVPRHALLAPSHTHIFNTPCSGSQWARGYSCHPQWMLTVVQIGDKTKVKGVKSFRQYKLQTGPCLKVTVKRVTA